MLNCRSYRCRNGKHIGALKAAAFVRLGAAEISEQLFGVLVGKRCSLSYVVFEAAVEIVRYIFGLIQKGLALVYIFVGENVYCDHNVQVLCSVGSFSGCASSGISVLSIVL